MLSIQVLNHYGTEKNHYWMPGTRLVLNTHFKLFKGAATYSILHSCTRTSYHAGTLSYIIKLKESRHKTAASPAYVYRTLRGASRYGRQERAVRQRRTSRSSACHA